MPLWHVEHEHFLELHNGQFDTGEVQSGKIRTPNVVFITSDWASLGTLVVEGNAVVFRDNVVRSSMATAMHAEQNHSGCCRKAVMIAKG